MDRPSKDRSSHLPALERGRRRGNSGRPITGGGDRAMRRGRAFLAACAWAGLNAFTIAHAQDASWPTKPVRFIVPFPPGGSVDPLARLTGVRLNAALGQQFVVDNRPG